jgi:hypothetical protein
VRHAKTIPVKFGCSRCGIRKSLATYRRFSRLLDVKLIFCPHSRAYKSTVGVPEKTEYKKSERRRNGRTGEYRTWWEAQDILSHHNHLVVGPLRISDGSLHNNMHGRLQASMSPGEVWLVSGKYPD